MMIPIIIHRLPFEKDHQSTSIVLYAVRCAQSSKNGGCPFWISLKNSHPCTKRVKDFRFRTLLRSTLHQPGSRDLVEV